MYLLAVLIVTATISPVVLEKIKPVSANVLGLNLIGQTATTQPASDIFVIENTTGYDDGFTRLIDLMGERNFPFYNSSTTGDNQGPNGLIAVDDIVMIKVNSQWNQRGGTNTDLLKAIIQAIVDHPDGFTGEIVVIENGQAQFGSIGEGARFNWTQNNAETHSQSILDVVGLFSGSDKVSTYLWDTIAQTSVFEYSTGDTNDGYVENGTANAATGIKVSYPKFNTSHGTLISFKNGIWNPSTETYDNGRLKLLNVPVLKSHSTYGVTASVKHYMGVVSNRLDSNNPHNSVGNGGMGTAMVETRMPDLNILDAIWINARPGNGPGTIYSDASRVNVIMASVDPIALDYWASKYVLMPGASLLGYSDLSTVDPDNTTTGFFGDWLRLSMEEIEKSGFQVTNNETQMNVFVSPRNQYYILATAGVGGSISPSGEVAVYEGDNQTFTISPDFGYHILDVLVNGSSVGVVSSYEFVNLTANKTIAVTFNLDEEYKIMLYEGWNLIGISLTLYNSSLEGIFQGNLSKVNYNYGFNNQAKDYTYWFQGLQPQYETLTQLECGQGYWIHVSENFTTTLNGSLGNKVPLNTGWNLVGINSTTPVSIEDYFATELSTIKSIHSYNAAAKTYNSWYKDVGDPADLLNPGKGYWVEIE